MQVAEAPYVYVHVCVYVCVCVCVDRYRGAAPVIRAIMDGVSHTGVSLAMTVLKCDAGPIVAQETVKVWIRLAHRSQETVKYCVKLMHTQTHTHTHSCFALS